MNAHVYRHLLCARMQMSRARKAALASCWLASVCRVCHFRSSLIVLVRAPCFACDRPPLKLPSVQNAAGRIAASSQALMTQ
jgi:hypothetical protein